MDTHLKENLFENNRVFIIAEAGSNWKCGSYDEDLQRAKDLINIAIESGADAIKFQTYRAETVYAKNAGASKYLSEQGIKEDIDEIFKKYEMPYEMISDLHKICIKEKILFMSTPFSVEDAKQIDPFVQVHKVASYELNHVRLLEFLSKTNKPILLSTGASSYDEIDFAVNLIKKKGKNRICLLQCTAKYPAPLESLNLAVIPKLKERYRVPVGLSDHSLDPIIGPVMAVGLGATIIEKHFTLDRNLPGPDHPFALNPSELKLMIKSIRSAEAIIGDGNKKILDVEVELNKYAKRSLQAIKKIRKGEKLQEGVNFDVLRPGNNVRGLDARFLDKINGKKAVRDFDVGEGIIN